MQARTQLSDELRRIPRTAVVIAILVLAGAIPGFALIFRLDPDTAGWPPFFFMALAAVTGVLLAIYVLLVGYVNADARRRGMSRLLWTLVVIFVPNALGFILYFLVRQPVQSACPHCGTLVSSGVNYCPRCGTQLAMGCPSCRSVVGPGDAFCANCGQALGEPSKA